MNYQDKLGRFLISKTTVIRLINENKTVRLLSLWNGVKIKDPNMRKVIFSISNSLKNFRFNEYSAFDWLMCWKLSKTYGLKTPVKNF